MAFMSTTSALFESVSRPKLRPKSSGDSEETLAFANFLYKYVYRHGMLPGLVMMTGFDESSIRRQLTGKQRLSRELAGVLVATMDRRDADELEAQYADAVRVRVRAELNVPALRQIDLFPRLNGVPR